MVTSTHAETLLADAEVGEDVGMDAESIYRDNRIIHVYEKDGKKLLDVYHPNQRIISREQYVNAIIKLSL